MGHCVVMGYVPITYMAQIQVSLEDNIIHEEEKNQYLHPVKYSSKYGINDITQKQYGINDITQKQST